MRSPNYPAIGLGAAVGLLEKMWGAQKRARVPLNTAVQNMGFKGPTGVTGTRVSALRKYGLLDDQPGSDVGISELGVKIVAPIKDGEREAALREAAEKVDLFTELREKYAGTDDRTLISVLTRDGFSDSGARQAIDAYRDTVSVAKLDKPAYNAPDDDDEDGANDQAPPLKPPRQKRRGEQGMTLLSFQVSDRLVEVAVDGGPLTKGELDTLKAYLAIQEKIAPAERVVSEADAPADDDA